MAHFVPIMRSSGACGVVLRGLQFLAPPAYFYSA